MRSMLVAFRAVARKRRLKSGIEVRWQWAEIVMGNLEDPSIAATAFRLTGMRRSGTEVPRAVP